MTSTKYEITIGQVDVAAVTKTAGAFFEGATIRGGLGLWQGKREPSVTVTVFGEASRSFDLLVGAFCKRACDLYGQECVLVERRDNVDAFLVDGTGAFRPL